MKRHLIYSFVAITIFLIFGTLPQAFATEAIPSQRTLKAIMKDMGPLFASLGRQISDASKNQDSIRLLHELNALTKESSGSRPDKIGKMPPEQQIPAEEKYQQMLAELDMLTVEAETALNKGDQTAARTAIRKMGRLRDAGHDEFQEF